MIVKILPPSAKFGGVRYNTNKTETGKGELMEVSGFGPLQAYSQLKPEDYVNYLEMISAGNKRVKKPQLHAIISAKGKSSSKEELTELAKKWLEKMGYKDQPYLLVFHNDTKNNHIHMVSTRVDKQGKKINSAFEKIRAITQLNKIMQQDEHQMARNDLDKALKYNISTKAQFMMVLESKGYILNENTDRLELIKFGKKLAEVPLAEVKHRIEFSQRNDLRAGQLTAILQKYRKQYSGVLREETTPLPGGLERSNAIYTSDLAVFLKEKFGIQLIFHGKPGRNAYGYTVIDHAGANVYKGSEILDLAELTADLLLEKELIVPEMVVTASDDQLACEQPASEPEVLLNTVELLPLAFTELESPVFVAYEPPITIDISDDIDDEAILGRNRNRKKKARTNTR
jgi:hypothetical protein